ncbi:MAG: hypothetical protein ACT4NY_09960 [Pseudonocardiales bacterium]
MMRQGRRPAVGGLLVMGSLLVVGTAAGCSQSPTPGAPTAGSSPTAAPSSSAVAEPVPPVAEPVPGVQFRDDCAELPLDVIGQPCVPRTPTAVPPAGGILDVFQNGDRDEVSQMLCSVLPDAEMEELLGGHFYVWTDSQYCYYEHLSEGDTRFVTTVSVGLVTDSVTEFRENDGANWQDYPVGTLAGGYVSSPDGRWFRIGLSSNPDLPGVLLILFSYREYGSLAFPATPAEVVPAWERYVQRVAQYVTRPA